MPKDEYTVEPVNENTESESKTDEILLTEEMHETAKEIEIELTKSNSFVRKFFLGIFGGFGTVVGATLLVAITVYILSILSSHGILHDFNEWLIFKLQGGGN